TVTFLINFLLVSPLFGSDNYFIEKMFCFSIDAEMSETLMLQAIVKNLLFAIMIFYVTTPLKLVIAERFFRLLEKSAAQLKFSPISQTYEDTFRNNCLILADAAKKERSDWNQRLFQNVTHALQTSSHLLAKGFGLVSQTWRSLSMKSPFLQSMGRTIHNAYAT